MKRRAGATGPHASMGSRADAAVAFDDAGLELGTELERNFAAQVGRDAQAVLGAPLPLASRDALAQGEDRRILAHARDRFAPPIRAAAPDRKSVV